MRSLLTLLTFLLLSSGCTSNKIAFEDFDEAKVHINKYWNELDSWWMSENVQIAREGFLKNFFNVKSNWQREWSDYVYFATSRI